MLTETCENCSGRIQKSKSFPEGAFSPDRTNSAIFLSFSSNYYEKEGRATVLFVNILISGAKRPALYIG